MKHCLVIDDSNSIRKVARRLFEQLQFETSEAASAAEGLEACRGRMPDCVVIDWQTPDSDGLQFISKLRAMPGGDQPKVIYLTSENDPAKIVRAVRVGANAHMMKPLEPAAVRKSIATAGLI